MQHLIKSALAAATLTLALASCGAATVKTPDAQPQASEAQGQTAGAAEAGAAPAAGRLQAAALAGDGPNIRVRVVIDRVVGFDTEDITGADEFYMGGDLVVSKPDGSKKNVPFLVAPPFDINDPKGGESHDISWTVLDEVVPPESDIVGQLVAYDEDAGKDWATVGPKFMDAAKATGDVLIQTGNAKAAIAAGALNAGMKVLDAAMSADKDDVLGLFGFEGTTFRYDSPGAIYRSKRIYKTSTWGWSTWNYYVYYHMEAERTYSAPTL
ncbi:hypothetical protein [Deinococcus multiflagellatus]|nr:hypothetical protein [Deinococcus multiflagellatus]MBZ9713836.1 hypothetical protein [Deinococcus multiflagellatus]